MKFLKIFSASFVLATAAQGAECFKAVSPIEKCVAPLMGTIPFETAMAHPWLFNTINHHECCKTDWAQLGCAHPIEKFETLETPESGFDAKFEMLLGQKPPKDFIKNGDPFAKLDFSKAPKLKAVFLSSLVFRSDFYGNVMARLLKYQAEHGALVNVTTTDYMLLDKDRALLEPIAAQNPNFKLDKFKYNNPNGIFSKVNNLVTDKFRDMHIKAFVTLSDEKESDNVVIFGGRNIHDGFLYKQIPDHSKYPQLVQYGPGKDDDFVHWNDFEAKVTSKELAESTAAHIQRFISRDKKTQAMVPFSGNKLCAAGSDTSKSKNTFQHFISVPYSDDHALEKQYVKLIDSAKTTIKLSSPYLRPTAAITEALERAAKRGIDIQIQTRVVLKGDTQSELYEEANKESINRFYNKAKIYEWKEDSILHSKFILVDDSTALIGSVNLSRRSFIQDVENGFLIHDTAVTQSMAKIFDSYLVKSAQITKPLPRKIIPSLKINLLENQF